LFLNWIVLYTPEVPKENLLVLELEVDEKGRLVLVFGGGVDAFFLEMSREGCD
jgi:hypothetical protein